MRDEIEESEQREEDWDRFYESKRKEMEEFQAVSQRFEEATREEVQRLRDLVSQVWSQSFASLNYALIAVPSLLILIAVCGIGIWIRWCIVNSVHLSTLKSNGNMAEVFTSYVRSVANSLPFDERRTYPMEWTTWPGIEKPLQLRFSK